MRYLFVVVLLLSGNLPLIGQTNILQQMQVPAPERFCNFSILEYGDHYYLITSRQGGPLNVQLNERATELMLRKYNKYSLQQVASVILAGDTLENDSIASRCAYMVMKDGYIHVSYAKETALGSAKIGMHHYMKLDTLLNVLVPDREIPEITADVVSLVPTDGGGCIIGHYTDPEYIGTSRYLVLDAQGQVTWADTLGQNANGPVWVRELVRIAPDRIIATGNSITGNHEGCGFGWAVYNDSMRLLDTFNYKFGLVQDPGANTLNGWLPRIASLPTGSLVSANTVRPNDDYPDRAYPRIAKHTAATRFGVDDYIGFGPVTATDTAHGVIFAGRFIAYNAHDNQLYFGAITHMMYSGTSCAANSSESLLEIISVDTNLNLRWRKFIRLGGECSVLTNITVPDGRAGILLSGTTLQDKTSLAESRWVYYVNDDTPSDSPTAISDMAIRKEDGFALWPNPATESASLMTFEAGIKEARVYSLQGKQVLVQPVVGGRAIIPLQQLSAGVYLVVCRDKNGKVFQKKLVKQ